MYEAMVYSNVDAFRRRVIRSSTKHYMLVTETGAVPLSIRYSNEFAVGKSCGGSNASTSLQG